MRLNWLDAIEEIAAEQWGREVADHEERDKLKAEFVNTPEKLAAYGIIALLRRITRPKFSNSYRDRDDEKVNPDYHVKLPDVNIGDQLWHADVEDSAYWSVTVIGKTEEGYCRVIEQPPKADGTYHDAPVGWAGPRDYPTLLDAVIASANREKRYCTRMLEKAEAALNAMENGEDPASYLDKIAED